jgi:hypothetical protein
VERCSPAVAQRVYSPGSMPGQFVAALRIRERSLLLRTVEAAENDERARDRPIGSLLADTTSDRGVGWRRGPGIARSDTLRNLGEKTASNANEASMSCRPAFWSYSLSDVGGGIFDFASAELKSPGLPLKQHS